MSIQGTQPHLDFRVPFKAARKVQKVAQSPTRRSNIKNTPENIKIAPY